MEKPPQKAPTPETTLIRPDDPSRGPAPVVLQLGNAEQSAAGAFSLGVLWNAVRQRMLLTIPLGIVVSAVACALLWYFTEEKHKATATLRIVDKHPYLAFQVSDHSQGFAQTQVELLRNNFIIEKAIESDNLLELPEIRKVRNREDPVLWITQRLKVERIGQSELYRVSFTSRYAESAQRVVAAVVKVYDEFQAAESDSQRQRILELLGREQKLRESDIAIKREKLRELKRQAGGDDAPVSDVATGVQPNTAQNTGNAVLASLRKSLIDAEVELGVDQAELAFLREKAAEPVFLTDEQVDEAVAADVKTNQLASQLQNEVETLSRLKPQSPGRAEHQASHDRISTALLEHKERLRPLLRKRLEDALLAKRTDALQQRESQVANKTRLIALLREKVDAERKRQADHGDKSLELEFARSELSGAEEVFERIAQRIVHMKTESRAPSPVTIIAPAKLPQFPEGPTLAKMLALVGVAGFFAPVCLFAGWDLLHRRVYEREQLHREVKVKFVSEVAALPMRPLIPRPGSAREYKQQALLFEESVNALRTTLSVDKALENCQVFVMASAVSGEGKTNLSSQLAMSFAQAEPGKVILIDADLRSPNVHELFEVNSGPGLAEVLRGEARLEDVTLMDWGDRLYILPAGDLRADSASQLFSGPAFRELMSKIRTQYRKIVIDVPPVLCASETLFVAKQADAVLMCALHEYSRAGQFKLAYERLEAAGVNVVGAVLNGAPVRRYAYAYRGYGVS